MQTSQNNVDKFVAWARRYLDREVRFVVEVGARDCEETVRFAYNLPDAQILTFECNPETLPICRENVADFPNIHLIEKAVANFEGETEFFQIDSEKTITDVPNGNPGASSLLVSTGKHPLEHYVQRSIRVPVTTLAAEMDAFQMPSIDLLWMDIQGAELMALDGLGERIQDVAFLHLEVGFFEIYEQQPLFEDVKKYLNEKGFLLLAFTSFRLYEGDAVFVNRRILSAPQLAMVMGRDKSIYQICALQQKTPRPLKQLFNKGYKVSKVVPPLLMGDCRAWKLKVFKQYHRLLLTGEPARSSVPIDVCIFAVPQNYAMLPVVVERIRANVKHPIGKIVIVGPDSPEIHALTQELGCTFRDVYSLIPVRESDIAYVVDGVDRSGWLLQQLSKLSVDQICTADHVLVIDGDTVLLRPHVFVKGDRTLLLYCDEYHQPYFDTYERLLGQKTLSCVSFTSHYLLLQPSKVQAMKAAMEQHTGLAWHEAIIQHTDRRTSEGFSVGDTYANFVFANYFKSVRAEYAFHTDLVIKGESLRDRLARLPAYCRAASYAGDLEKGVIPV